jgi:hypothetical protein
MDRFIARENIRHYCDMLSSDIEPQVRSSVHKLLVQEEDKLGKDLELLSTIEKQLAAGARRIETQQLRVRVLLDDGSTDAARAQACLDGMMESQRVLVGYYQSVAKEVDRNRLLDR